MKELIKIQRMCFHDGPGVRTTLFFKGCPLTCPWCCNIENTDIGLKYFNKDNLDESLYGKFYVVDELVDIILKDKSFYKNDGGVTYSGGEPLIHTEYLKELSRKLKENNINIAVETSLCIDLDKLKEVSDFIDFYYVDVKSLDENKANNIFHIDLNKYFDNIKYLISNNKKIVLRWTMTNDIEDNEVIKVIDFMKENNLSNIEICSVHNLAKNKYEKLGIKYNDFKVLSKEELENVKNQFILSSINSIINSI